MTAGRGVCVKRVVGERWQALNVSQTKHFVKNKYNLFYWGRGGKGGKTF